MDRKTDLRILRTRKSINDAFCALLQEKNYDKITVQDIADRAIINRNTFYLHFRDKDDLLERLSMEHLNGLQQILERIEGVLITEGSVRPLILAVLGEISRNRMFYEIMLCDGQNTYFAGKLHAIITAQICRTVKMKEQDAQALFCAEYIVSGFIGAIKYTLLRQKNLSVEQTSEWIFQIIFDNALKLLHA